MRTVIAAALLLGACQTEPPAARVPGDIAQTGDVVLVVNGNKVTENMIEGVTRRMPPEQIKQMEAQGAMDQLYDRVALGQVLYTEAVKRELHLQPTVIEGLAMAEREFLAGELLQAVGAEAITDEAVQAWYDERKVQYGRPQVQARHILVKEKSLADDLMGQLKGGADFATLSKEHSTDTRSAERGGDLGWFEDGRMDPAFSEAAFGAAKDELVGPIETRYGFHVIQVTDKRDSTPLEDVRDQIEGALRQDAMEKYMTETKGALTIEKPGATDDKPAEAAAAPPAAEAKPEGHP